VSPSNLFISRTGDIKLGDFGVARGLIDAGAADVMGKPYYLSPETLGGVVSPATDLWAATVTLFELVTLQRPFTGKTPDEVFAKVKSGERPSLKELRPDVPPGVAAVIDRGFAPEVKQRFPDAASYAKALAPLYDERVGTPLAISAVVRGLFGTQD
jgi:serine/threonine-protein kinase